MNPMPLREWERLRNYTQKLSEGVTSVHNTLEAYKHDVDEIVNTYIDQNKWLEKVKNAWESQKVNPTACEEALRTLDEHKPVTPKPVPIPLSQIRAR